MRAAHTIRLREFQRERIVSCLLGLVRERAGAATMQNQAMFVAVNYNAECFEPPPPFKAVLRMRERRKGSIPSCDGALQKKARTTPPPWKDPGKRPGGNLGKAWKACQVDSVARDERRANERHMPRR